MRPATAAGGEPICGACQTGPRASSGLVPRSGAKVPHVFVQSRSLEYTSSLRGAPSQRPGDNSTTIARTTAKRHSKAARKARSSCSYPSSWLLPLRDDAGRSRAARLLWRRGHLQTYDGGRKAAHASEALRQIRTWMVTGSDTSPQRETHAPCAGRAPGRCTPNHRCQNYFGSTATTHLQSTATDRRRRRRKRRKKGC